MSIVITNGSFTVTIAQTGVAQSIVSSSKLANRCDVAAASTNSGVVIVGASNILSDLSQGGIPLNAGDIYNIELITDLKPVYVVGTAGDKILINYWIGDRN